MFDPQVKPKVKNYIRLLEVQDRTIPRPEMEEFRERLANALAGAVPKCSPMPMTTADARPL